MENDSEETKLKKLQFYRSEIQHEYTLLYSRVSTYVTSQSFLTIAFASAMNNRGTGTNDIFSLWFPIVLSLIGIITSVTVRGGINGAIQTIALWHIKQDRLFANDVAMDDYYVSMKSSDKRDPIDKKHRRILEFAQIMPYVFLVAWCLFAVLDIYLHIK
jgi:hypothetical protein